jgi:hypothetical protein
MTKPQTRSVCLPFVGFYESWYSQALDNEQEQWVVYDVTEREDGEAQHPVELRLTEGELHDLILRHTDYGVQTHAIAREYVGAFATCASDALDLPLDLRFEEMTSPKFYNFETDRIFATLPLSAVRALFAMSKADGHKSLARTLEGRHSSYDGFHSYYQSDVAAWLAKPIATWDHNELDSLLRACLDIKGVDWPRFEMELYEATDTGDGAFMGAWEAGIDWPALDSDREDLRAEKAAELGIASPDWRTLPAVRHPDQIALPL